MLAGARGQAETTLPDRTSRNAISSEASIFPCWQCALLATRAACVRPPNQQHPRHARRDATRRDATRSRAASPRSHEGGCVQCITSRDPSGAHGNVCSSDTGARIVMRFAASCAHASLTTPSLPCSQCGARRRRRPRSPRGHQTRRTGQCLGRRCPDQPRERPPCSFGGPGWRRSPRQNGCCCLPRCPASGGSSGGAVTSGRRASSRLLASGGMMNAHNAEACRRAMLVRAGIKRVSRHATLLLLDI